MAHVFYPEMGGKPDETKLFHAYHVINSTFAVAWLPARDEEARTVFKRLRLRPRSIELAKQENLIAGATPKWSALISSTAYVALRPFTSIEMLLD